MKKKTGRPRVFSDEDIEKAILLENGLMTRVADRLKINYTHLIDRISSNPTLKAAKDKCREVALDDAESGLQFLVKKKKDLGAICFTLKTIGRMRGYQENQQISITPEMEEAFQETMSHIKNFGKKKVEDGGS